MEILDYSNNKILIKTPNADDFERIKTICEDRFGKGYIKKDEYLKWIADTDYCKVAVADGKIVGIVYLMPQGKKELATYFKLDLKYVEDVSGGKGVIHSRCAALDKEYEKRGIMYFLHEVIFDNIKANGFGAVFAPAWTYNGFTPMAKFMDKFGFEYIGEKEDIWYGLEDYKCIICGGRCRCKAAIYIKKY